MEMAAAPGAGGDHFDFFFPLAHHFEGIGEAGQGDDGGAVLVVVEDGDVAFSFSLRSISKAAGAEISSRLMPPKEPAMRATALTNSSTSWVRTQRGRHLLRQRP